MTRDEWIEAFARELGVEAPDAGTIETLLNLAGVAAHSSERTAAPIACWLAARAGVAPDHAVATAESLRPAAP
jgi:hypothetical protein